MILFCFCLVNISIFDTQLLSGLSNLDVIFVNVHDCLDGPYCYLYLVENSDVMT